MTPSQSDIERARYALRGPWAEKQIKEPLIESVAQALASERERAAGIAEESFITVTFELDGTVKHWATGKQIAAKIRSGE